MKNVTLSNFIKNPNSTYIILEIARTYNNDLKTAERMISIAAAAGVNAIKIQSIFADELMVNNHTTEEYVKMLKTLERSIDDHLFLKKKCEENGLEFISTPEGLSMVDLLEKCNVGAYKISSLNINFTSLLSKIAVLNKPIIISTGMANNNEIDDAVKTINSSGNNQLIIMHCSSLYPTDLADARIGTISYLKNRYKDNIIGYSDHTIGIDAAILAVALGACVVEKHFTLDRTQDGLDHVVAVDVPMLFTMVQKIRETELMIGTKERYLPEKERLVSIRKRRKIIINQDILAGELLTIDKLSFLQTNDTNGIQLNYLNDVLGRKSKINLVKNHILNHDDVE